MKCQLFRVIDLLVVLSSLVSLPLISCELFTALVHLEKLLNTEKQIVGSLEEYLSAEEQRLKQLRRLSKHYSELNLIASKDTESYLANPINAYLLVKRLTTDWKEVEALIQSDKRHIIDVLQQNETFPSAEDLSGAAEALLRLQDTYKLDTTSLANGFIPVMDTKKNELEVGVQPPEIRIPLSSNDCFELGRQAYINQDYYHTVLWMQEALDRLEREDLPTDLNRAIILEYLAFSTYQKGNVRLALQLTHQLLDISPDHPRAQGNIDYYERELSQNINAKKRGDDGEVPMDDAIVESANSWSVEETERQTYEALCRGEKRISDKTASQLMCFYLNTTYIPFLKLIHIKVEEAFKRPQIVIFHDFMSDYEIEVVKSLSEPKLKRATVQNSVTGNLETAKYRISKSAWLTNREHPVVQRITQRISAITGLELSTAEELQVVNYGIGGHYEPHFDFARREEKDAFKSLGTGNRIATWLNYMSNVEAGGATVFPHLGITLWPKKSTAAFWYNLHKSGDGDLLTRHAACPVLVGSKWVSNKWIHERGQEFRKPCGLKINEYNIIQNI
ncbi:prolyl 4-hydroxylase subunit alpha-1-like [Oppia nitens]|uniref:prolyl 4-hydroxylase subunit alpha-1-like n=1 Tax=Oppia nitens TaxID=1686743 RepID=UPI0023DA78F7|nr:prolyl 4-hydroxylase subunit alpha-1-like [Oppia nitens]